MEGNEVNEAPNSQTDPLIFDLYSMHQELTQSNQQYERKPLNFLSPTVREDEPTDCLGEGRVCLLIQN